MTENERDLIKKFNKKAADFWRSDPDESEVEAYARGCQMMLNMAVDGIPKFSLARLIQSIINEGGAMTSAALGLIATAEDMLRDSLPFVVDDDIEGGDESTAASGDTPPRRVAH